MRGEVCLNRQRRAAWTSEEEKHGTSVFEGLEGQMHRVSKGKRPLFSDRGLLRGARRSSVLKAC